MTEKILLIGDIGGTNARFALADPEQLEFHNAMTFKCADYASADKAIRHYLDELSVAAPDAICLAAAGPVIGGNVSITNNHWTLNAQDISAEFNIDAVRLLNDFEAAAYSIPQLRAEDLESIGLPRQKPLSESRFDVAITGPGTGLGMAGLMRRGAELIPIVGEGGNIGFAPTSQLQVEILNVLRNEFEPVSVERLLSGPGLENIYLALSAIHGEQAGQLSVREIFANGGEGGDQLAVESINIFFEILGQAAGDLALTMGAEDGVYIAGGIAKRYPAMLRQSEFRNAFDDKGHYRAYMERIPTLLITHAEPGLLGAAYCASRTRTATC